jgi:hypothetical protein
MAIFFMYISQVNERKNTYRTPLRPCDNKMLRADQIHAAVQDDHLSRVIGSLGLATNFDDWCTEAVRMARSSYLHIVVRENVVFHNQCCPLHVSKETPKEQQIW